MRPRASPRPSARPSPVPHPARLGLLFGTLAYAAWGVLPIYFKWLKAFDPVSIVAYRVCWSLLVLSEAALSTSRFSARK